MSDIVLDTTGWKCTHRRWWPRGTALYALALAEVRVDDLPPAARTALEANGLREWMAAVGGAGLCQLGECVCYHSFVGQDGGVGPRKRILAREIALLTLARAADLVVEGERRAEAARGNAFNDVLLEARPTPSAR
jgi:hypothetical protein